MKENSIEEDIILLKDFTEGNFKRDKLENYKGSYKMGYFYYKDIQQALDHILSDYKRVLKENEGLKDTNCLVKRYFKLKDTNTYLQKENEDLKEYIAIAPNLDEMTAIKYRNIQENAYVQGRAEEQQKAKKIINENYIPKQKVKDKIEKLKNNPLKIKQNDKYYYETDAYNKIVIQVLQELLEGRK